MDTILAFKLVLTPIFIGLVSAFARRFGPRAGGWLAGLPLTSGPISIFVALEQGPAFAARAAPATILGIFPVAAFCLVWCRLAHRGFRISYACALGAYVVLVPIIVRAPAHPWVALGLTLSALFLALLALPKARRLLPGVGPPRWDVPIRMIVATSLIVLLTGIAHILGPQWTGLLSPFPVFATVLAGFHHRHDGPDAAIAVLRGILTGVMAFCAFFFVVAVALPTIGLIWTYVAASVCAVLVNGVNGLLLRHASPAAADSDA